MKTNALVPLINNQIEKINAVTGKINAIGEQIDPLIAELKSETITFTRAEEIVKIKDELMRQSKTNMGNALFGISRS